MPGGPLKLKGFAGDPLLFVGTTGFAVIRKLHCAAYHCSSSEEDFDVCAGDTPWLIDKKKKKKKKHRERVSDDEDQVVDGQILGNGESFCVLRRSSALRSWASVLHCRALHTDGKPIDPSSISVQSSKTYEQEFAYELEKLKVSKPCCLYFCRKL